MHSESLYQQKIPVSHLCAPTVAMHKTWFGLENVTPDETVSQCPSEATRWTASIHQSSSASFPPFPQHCLICVCTVCDWHCEKPCGHQESLQYTISCVVIRFFKKFSYTVSNSNLTVGITPKSAELIYLPLNSYKDIVQYNHRSGLGDVLKITKKLKKKIKISQNLWQQTAQNGGCKLKKTHS